MSSAEEVTIILAICAKKLWVELTTRVVRLHCQSLRNPTILAQQVIFAHLHENMIVDVLRRMPISRLIVASFPALEECPPATSCFLSSVPVSPASSQLLSHSKTNWLHDGTESNLPIHLAHTTSDLQLLGLLVVGWNRHGAGGNFGAF